MCVGRPYEDHRRQIAAMDLATSPRDADSDRSNVLCLGFAGDMHKNITAATFWRDETETFVRIENFTVPVAIWILLIGAMFALPRKTIECAGDAQPPRIAATRSIDH